MYDLCKCTNVNNRNHYFKVRDPTECEGSCGGGGARSGIGKITKVSLYVNYQLVAQMMTNIFYQTKTNNVQVIMNFLDN